MRANFGWDATSSATSLLLGMEYLVCAGGILWNCVGECPPNSGAAAAGTAPAVDSEATGDFGSDTDGVTFLDASGRVCQVTACPPLTRQMRGPGFALARDSASISATDSCLSARPLNQA